MKLPVVENEFFVPQGGQDIVSPPLLLRNGVAFDAQNWECSLDAGYAVVGGYDRYVDGDTASEMDFQIVIISVITGQVVSGETLTGAISGASFTVGVLYDGDDPHEINFGATSVALYVTDVSGQFILGETLDRVAGLTPATVYLDALPTVPGVGGTPQAVEIARARAEAAMRAYMDKPGAGSYSGSILTNLTRGPTLGAFVLNDTPYVVKAKNPRLTETEDTNAVFVRPATTLGQENRYWEVATDQANIPTDQASFEFVASNFANPAGAEVIFGVSGTSKAFYYTGSTFGFITTGMTDDRPSHLAIHANRVFLAFKGSLQYSSLPASDVTAEFPHLTWSPLEGLAGEIAMNSDITGLLSLTGSQDKAALLVSTKDQIFILYGNSEEDFVLVPFSANTGALTHTLQWMGQPVFQNIFGLTQLSATDRFGGFREGTITPPVKPFMDARRGKATASMICRNKNQYRIFFEDGTALYVTFQDGKPIGMFTQKFKHKVTCAWSCVLSDDTELMLIGTEDGGLYKLDVGTSFAGETIPHFIRFAFNQFKSPRILKGFKRSTLEISSEGYAQCQVGYDLDYGSNRRLVTAEATLESPDFGSGGFWDDGTWDDGNWDGAVRTPFVVDTPGSGVNFSIRLRGDDAISRPINVSGITIDYTFRRAQRGQ